MKKLVYSLLTISLFGLAACEEKSDPSYDTANFTSVFDNNTFSNYTNYTPIDIKETSDGGFLILADRQVDTLEFNTAYRGIYLMKADKFGNFVSEFEVPEPLVNAAGPLLKLGEQYYFFCMDNLSTEARLVEVNENAEVVATQNVAGFTNPAATSLDDANQEFLVLGYNHIDKLTTFARVSPGAVIQGEITSFAIGVGNDDIDKPLLAHYLRQGRKLPFAVGKAGSLFYFNGFINYTFSLVMFAPGENPVRSIVQGQQSEGGFSALLPLAGNKFSAARFNYGDNFLIPNQVIPISGISSSVDYGGFTLPELVPNADIKILRATVNTKTSLIFAGDTRSKQIALFFYDDATGTFMSTRYFGFSNPYQIGAMIQTSDSGLAVCGTTYIAGRFPRIFIYKISKDALGENIR